MYACYLILYREVFLNIFCLIYTTFKYFEFPIEVDLQGFFHWMGHPVPTTHFNTTSENAITRCERCAMLNCCKQPTVKKGLARSLRSVESIKSTSSVYF